MKNFLTNLSKGEKITGIIAIVGTIAAGVSTLLFNGQQQERVQRQTTLDALELKNSNDEED